MTRLAVRVQPGARADGLVGWMADGTLKLTVRAAPEDGRANRAVTALIAATLGVRVSAVRVQRGAASRSKVVEVDGMNESTARALIAAALEGTGGRA
ncbi:MAG: DUF167 domain-containing protein [Candidatus Eisenbacteria bacterium]|uniref:UPF0235 protein HY076_01965 n=1 Tax=Eiseniibacteriota bacterium TaxID=2212470 RepID=A0A9D6L537_UNCEI|nr:DUF167 domain-containing protein [Candidatus Eisenbacteria bacterium]MBI3539023.1 DUF167 domain-containing protein [Candidatus Eisenbacteria bacterium]